MFIQPCHGLQGTVCIPADKSISHRSIMLGSLALGTTTIHNFLMGDDCLSTLNIFRKLGVNIQIDGTTVKVKGNGLHGLTAPSDTLDCGNSGTTARLLSGILAGQSFDSTLTGDASLQKRPMNRIIKPLLAMNGKITAHDNNFCPLHITPSSLKGITYHSPIASAQVKSCILLAGLYASGSTTVVEPFLSRDHTERMLASFGVNVKRSGKSVTITPPKELYAVDITVPGDISSAAFFIVAGLIIPHSDLIIKNVGINPTRRGILDVLIKMGGHITLLNEREVCKEPVCDLHVKTSILKGTIVEGAIIPTLIDEIPILATAACFAEGQTIIKDASELRVKESDRIECVCTELAKMGASITATPDGFVINGGFPLKGATLESCNDHRLAMSLAIASLNATSASEIKNADCVSISFPCFFDLLHTLSHKN